jgi:hypothetical protein
MRCHRKVLASRCLANVLSVLFSWKRVLASRCLAMDYSGFQASYDNTVHHYRKESRPLNSTWKYISIWMISWAKVYTSLRSNLEGTFCAQGTETSILRLRNPFLKILLFPLASYAQLNFLLCVESKTGLTFQFASPTEKLHLDNIFKSCPLLEYVGVAVRPGLVLVSMSLFESSTRK